MAFISNTAAARSDNGFGGFFSGLVARYSAWRSYRVTVKALSALSDAELDDIGLTRGEISRVARRAV